MNSRNLSIGAAYKVLRVPPDSVPQIPLLSVPYACFNHRHKKPFFVVLPLSLKKPLGDPVYNYSHTVVA